MEKVALRRKKKKKINQFHQYYKRKGVYTFLWKNSLKVIVVFAVIIAALVFVKSQIPDFDARLEVLLDTFNTPSVLSIFLLSESLLGLIPPDFFIVWAKKFDFPYLMVGFLGVLSYLGGAISYFIGKYIGGLPKVEKWIKKKFIKHFELIRKWGGVLIVFAALFPLPFSAVCIVAGAVRFPLPAFFTLGLFRFVRFFGYALVLFNVV